MIYHPHDGLRDFLRDYLTIHDSIVDPATGEPVCGEDVIQRAMTSPWRLCLPTSSYDWVVVERPRVAVDYSERVVLGEAVRQALGSHPVHSGAAALDPRNDPEQCIIRVDAIGDTIEAAIDALEFASRIYTRIAVADIG